MAVDLDALLAARGPDVFIEAILGGRTVKFAPLTIHAIGLLTATPPRLREGLLELLPDPEDRETFERVNANHLDDLLIAIYGSALGKSGG